ncbi:hypothetical protein PYW07_011658 [Mythimna separata]|uniref:Uncharacterized protein n=1 Tax=Mythimna separata TaxID=271217 RepID=A0AAD8DKL0_MYTSE|nr:hypothetical protein PYW07_011658 [Mythimna separata]
MAFKVIAFVCLQLALFNTINAHCANRFIPGLQQNIVPVAETLLPNQMIIGPNYGPPILDIHPYGMETLVANQMPAPTIIQDSTVANNLANALQLLVVSNLLSNTLPLSPPDVVPSLGFASPMDFGLMSPVGPVMSPVGPVMSPVGPMVSPMNSCGFGPYNYVY